MNLIVVPDCSDLPPGGVMPCRKLCRSESWMGLPPPELLPPDGVATGIGGVASLLVSVLALVGAFGVVVEMVFWGVLSPADGVLGAFEAVVVPVVGVRGTVVRWVIAGVVVRALPLFGPLK